MDLVRDLLDKKVVDRNGRALGRVDSVILEIDSGSAPRVGAIEIGPEVLAHRLHPVFGRMVEALEHLLRLDAGRPVRFAWTSVIEFEPQVKVDVAFQDTAAARIEQLLRSFVSRIPGSS